MSKIQSMRALALPVVLAAAGALSAGCGDGGEGGGGAAALDRSKVVAILGTEVFADRPAPDPRMVELGRKLYHEQRLSKQGNLSCASCHDLAKYGQDGEPTSPGSTGERGGRNSPTSINAFRQLAQFWDGRAATVEEQATGPVMNPIEHGLAGEAELVGILEGDDAYVTAFKECFAGESTPITLANFGKAVGAFERTLKTHSRFDDYLEGDEEALTAAEKAGLKTFMEVGCVSCHMGRTVGGSMYRKLGERVPYETADKGRGAHTGNAAEDYMFKVPMLLNVAETAPYFHDGSVATLEEAVRLMGKHQLDVELSDAQVTSIVTFLKSLTGTLPQ